MSEYKVGDRVVTTDCNIGGLNFEGVIERIDRYYEFPYAVRGKDGLCVWAKVEPKRETFYIEMHTENESIGVYDSKEDVLSCCDEGTIIYEVVVVKKYKVVKPPSKLEEIK